MSAPGEVLVAKDRAEHAALAAELVARAIVEAVKLRGFARVAISGGSTPSDAYKHLASLELPWDRVAWFQVDERAVPLASDRSNWAQAGRDFGARFADGAPGERHRMPADEADLAKAADAYERLLRASFGVARAAAFDAITLGVGDDGHTASLFPGLGVVGRDDRLVLDVREQPEKKLEARLTLTTPVLREARLVVVLARGAGKRAILERAFAKGSEEEIPSRLLQRASGHVAWVLDREAAPDASD